MKQFRKHPLGAVGFAVLIFWVVIAVFAPMISPYSYTEINVDAQLLGPGDGHFLGTDLMGRDILSRIFEGSRSIILISLFTSIISTSLGILVGFARRVIFHLSFKGESQDKNSRAIQNKMRYSRYIFWWGWKIPRKYLIH